jgi:hypothetical protein
LSSTAIFRYEPGSAAGSCFTTSSKNASEAMRARSALLRFCSALAAGASSSRKVKLMAGLTEP